MNDVDQPILINTEIKEISDNISLKLSMFLGKNGNMYQRSEIYYKDTSDTIDLGLIHYEDPDHLNMVERVEFSKSFVIVVRKNLATGEITGMTSAFDTKNKTKIYEQSKIKLVYERILYEQIHANDPKVSYDPIYLLLDGTSKALKFLFGDKKN